MVSIRFHNDQMDEELRRMQSIVEEMFHEQNGIEGLNLLIPRTNAVFQVMFGSDSEKDSFKYVFTDYCRLNQIDRFFLISESWMVQSAFGLDPSIRPSKRSDRIEILVCALISSKGNEMGWAKIEEEDGKRFLGPWQDHQGAAQSPYWDECLNRPSSN
jgi:hypothetical protein